MKRSIILAAAVACALVLSNATARADELQDASAMFKEGQYPSALAKVNAYLQHKPKNPQARFLKGLILTEENKINDAIGVFSDLSQDYPELPEPYNNLAVLYAAQGQYDKAKTALESAIKTHPSYATAHENLGDIYAKMASQAYDKALQLDQSNTKVQTKLALIKELFSAAKMHEEKTPAPKKIAKSEPKERVAAEPKEQAAAEGNSGEVISALEAWAKAWSAQDVGSYLASYAQEFKTPHGESLDAWKAERKDRIEKPKSIEVKIIDPAVTFVDANHARVRFTQTYRATHLKDTAHKMLTLVKVDGKWLIDSEKVER